MFRPVYGWFARRMKRETKEDYAFYKIRAFFRKALRSHPASKRFPSGNQGYIRKHAMGFIKDYRYSLFGYSRWVGSFSSAFHVWKIKAHSRD